MKKNSNNLELLFGVCPYATAQQILIGKWAIVVMEHLVKNKILRFSELQRLLPGITQSSLTKQLRILEEYRIVLRVVYPEVPPKVEYSLTEIGQEFHHVLEALDIWGSKYIVAIND